MKKIDTSTWREFKISDIFTISSPKQRSKKTYLLGDIPFVSSKCINNGIDGYFMPKKEELLEHGNCISVSPLDGASFYQENDFLARGGAGSAISLLYSEKLTKYNALFICSILKKTAIKFDYNDALTGDNLSNLIIKLPVDKKGFPDWKYMEDYINEIKQKVAIKLKQIQSVKSKKENIDCHDWKFFKLYDLFSATNTGNILLRDIENDSGFTPYVTASGINNGVVTHIDASKYDIIKGHCILIGGKTFTITYQADDFVSNDSHNFTLRSTGYNISDLSYKYLITVIRSYFGQKYSWDDAVTKDVLLNEEILLPVNSKDEPDWEYMDSFMKRIMNDAQSRLDNLLMVCE